MKRFKDVADIRFEREQFEYAVDAWLRSKGWKPTSNTPGCLWLWEKEITHNGISRTVLAPKELALSIEERENG